MLYILFFFFTKEVMAGMHVARLWLMNGERTENRDRSWPS